jgi:hypothetical protein
LKLAAVASNSLLKVPKCVTVACVGIKTCPRCLGLTFTNCKIYDCDLRRN